MATDTIPQAAIDKISQVHDVVFFSKLAAMPHPVVPRTQTERDQLLKVAAHVREKHDQELQKQASVGNPFLNGLLEVLGEPAAAPASHNYNVKQAAAHWAKDPAIAEAALEYNNWLLGQGN